MKKILSLVLILLSTICFSQTTININSDQRFMGQIKGTGATYDDETGMMKDFTLKLQWWTLLGEPIEIYGFLWNTTGSYSVEIDGSKKSISRTQLSKYPDLVKRFDNIRPNKVDLFIYGNADGKSTSVKRGNGFAYASFYNKGIAYKTKGQSYDPYTLDAPILYNIPDAKLLVSKSGRMSMSTVPESPMYWNGFLRWAWRSSSPQSGPTKGYVINKSEDEFKNYNQTKKDELNKELKYLYKNTTSFTLNAEIENLEWPMYELKGIIQDFEKYEKGEKEPSPSEEVKEAEKEIAKETTYTKDDFWGEVSEVEKPYPVKFEEGGMYGVKYSNTNNIILPAKYYWVGVKSHCIVAKIKEGDVCSSSYQHNNKVLFDLEGNPVITEPFSDFMELSSMGINFSGYTIYDGVAARYQIKRTTSKKYTSKSTANARDERWIPWVTYEHVDKLSKDLKVIYEFDSDNESLWGKYKCK